MSEYAPFALFALFLLFMFFKVPVSWALGISSFIAMMMDGNYPIAVAAQRIFVGLNVYTLLAVPFFLLAGEIMAKGGLSARLVNFAESIVGFLPGGLSLVAILSCTFFAAISGASVATTAVIGGLLLGEMKKRGYPNDYSAAIMSVGGTLGIIIPPSIVFVLYGTATNVSVVDLLMSGVIPGLISSLGLCALAYYFAKVRNYPKNDKKFSFIVFRKTLKESFFALMMPVIVLGGIYAGIFTPTESAVVAVLYSILAAGIYRELTLKDLPGIFINIARSTANLMILICTAQYFGWMILVFNIPTILTRWIMTFATTPAFFMLLVIILLIICGMFIESAVTVLILGPILAPIAQSFGINDVHFGLVVVFLLALGQASPPFGTTLFTAIGISGESSSKVSRQVLPFLGVQVACTFLFAYVPILSTWLPETMK